MTWVTVQPDSFLTLHWPPEFAVTSDEVIHQLTFLLCLKMPCNHPGHGDVEHVDVAGEHLGEMWSLYTQISMDGCKCLNESTPGSVRSIWKPFERRAERVEVI